jgi:aspartate-semialdehyde dehydrogenase
MKLYDVAVVGATGLVGRKVIEVLESRNFPVGKLRLLATDKSLGVQIDFKGKTHLVEKLTPDSFKGYEFAFFCAGGPWYLALWLSTTAVCFEWKKMFPSSFRK